MDTSVHFNYNASEDDEVLIKVALAVLLPAIKTTVMASGTVGSFIAILYPDHDTCKAKLGIVVADDGKGARANNGWKPYTVRMSPKWAKPIIAALDMDKKRTLVIGVGFYDRSGQVRIGAVQIPWTLTFADQLNVVTNSIRSLVEFEIPASAASYDLATLVDTVRGACATCGRVRECGECGERGECGEGGERGECGEGFRTCESCDCVTYCSVRCEQSRRKGKHGDVACQHAAYARNLLKSDNDVDVMFIVRAPILRMPLQRLRMECNGVFDDARRSRILWDVTKPPSEARLVPSCVHPWMAWTQHFRGLPLSPSHLSATVPSGLTTMLRISYVDENVDMRDTEDVRDFMDNVHRGLRRLADSRGKNFDKAIGDHTRFDHLQPRDEPRYWRMQTGGDYIYHEGIASTGYSLSKVMFVD